MIKKGLPISRRTSTKGSPINERELGYRETESDSEKSPMPNKNDKHKSSSSKPAPTPAPHSVPTDAALKLVSREENFSWVGDLVWGRMAGFPFWASPVTRSPQGQYCRDAGKGKVSYHVQFFNWNDESEWVQSVIEFDSLEPFKKLAAKKKSDKSYNPAKGAMHSRWEKAAREVEETMGLTRPERTEQHIMTYGSQHPVKAFSMPKSKPVPKTIKSSPKPTAPKPPVRKTVEASPMNPTPGQSSRTGRPSVPYRRTKNREGSSTASQEAFRTLRRLRAGDNNQESGEVSLPSAAHLAVQAARLGLPWPRVGSHRCEGCKTCLEGNCRRQKLETVREGCRRKKACEILVCLQPWRPDASPGSAGTLGNQANHLEQAMATFGKAHYALTAAPRCQELAGQNNLGRHPRALRQNLLRFKDLGEDLVQQASVKIMTLARSEEAKFTFSVRSHGSH